MWLIEKIKSMFGPVELIDLIKGTPNSVLSEKEKKEWIERLSIMTNEQKRELEDILVRAKKKLDNIWDSKEIIWLKRFYKDDIDKIDDIINILENAYNTITDTKKVKILIFVKFFKKNPFKKKYSIDNILPYLSKEDMGIINKKIKLVKSYEDKINLPLEYKSIQDWIIRIAERLKELEKYDFITDETIIKLIWEERVKKYNNFLAKIYYFFLRI